MVVYFRRGNERNFELGIGSSTNWEFFVSIGIANFLLSALALSPCRQATVSTTRYPAMALFIFLMTSFFLPGDTLAGS